ncbi:urease subunit beta [Streptomyces sp. NPDC004609]|uniref:urease subunit beta n=1 Tax=Streptomyces sp. NPDC004609 TaxID=3364704 RepID=UPI003682AB5D
MIPGEFLHADGPVRLNEGREVTRITVVNAADRPVQIGSHYHFAEANPGLRFDRVSAHGKRLHVAAGTAVRFEPGIPVDVELVPIAGLRTVPGLRGDTGGALDPGGVPPGATPGAPEAGGTSGMDGAGDA